MLESSFLRYESAEVSNVHSGHPAEAGAVGPAPGGNVPEWGCVFVWTAQARGGWRRAFAPMLRGLLCCLMLGVLAIEAGAAPKLGTRSSSIGTFNGWVFSCGWEGSFSDTYAPEKEKYAWTVFLAPEAIYVALLAQQAVYSAVDVNMGIKYFYGFMQAPNAAATVTDNLISEQLWSISFSIGYPDAIPPVGVMSQLSMGFEVEQAFVRIKGSKQLLAGVQYGAGYGASFSLLPITLPFTVELDRDWIPANKEPAASLFWPIVVWNRTVDPARNPIDQMRDALRDLSTRQDVPATAMMLGSTLQPLMDRAAADQDLRSFVSNPSGSSRIRQAISATEQWLVTGDTAHLPDSLKPIQAPAEVKETVKPVLAATQLAFETGYRVGAQANPNNRTMYVDGIVTNYCVVGEKCTLEVPVKELTDVVPARGALEFEGGWIGFDVPIEGAGSYEDLGRVEWVQITNGVARFTIAQSLSTPQLLGVRYDDPTDKPLNSGRDIELKRRLILFVDPNDADHNGIPDFWETQYHLANHSPGADADGDGMTDYQEYMAATNPTNAQDVLTLQLDGRNKELVLPFATNVRRYVIEANTNSIGDFGSWKRVMSFMGSDAKEQIDISGIFRERKAFFRVRVEKP